MRLECIWGLTAAIRSIAAGSRQRCTVTGVQPIAVVHANSLRRSAASPKRAKNNSDMHEIP